MSSNGLLGDRYLGHVSELPGYLDNDSFQAVSQEQQVSRLNRQYDALVIEIQELQEEIDHNHRKQDKLREAERTLQGDLARVQHRLAGVINRREAIERPLIKRPADEVYIPPCTAESSNKKRRLGQGQYSSHTVQGGSQHRNAGNSMTSASLSASSTTASATVRDPLSTGSLGHKIMTFLSQGKDYRSTDDSMAETVNVLVDFELTLTTEALVDRLRDLVNRVPEIPPSRYDNTVESIARMSFDFENVRGLKFTIMCVKAQRISSAKFDEEQEARSGRGERLRKESRKVTWYAETFAKAEAKIEGKTANMTRLKTKWSRFLSYGLFLIDMTELIGNEAGLIRFSF